MVAVMVYKLEIFEGAVEEWEASKFHPPTHPVSRRGSLCMYLLSPQGISIR